MSSHVWCHGPLCHTYSTVDRVRGSKGSKVLRTRKVKVYDLNNPTLYSYFCSMGCYNDFAHKFVQQIVRIEPRTEPLETPIEDPKKTEHETSWGHKWTHTQIKKIDNETNVG
jgi:hypothetical protein